VNRAIRNVISRVYVVTIALSVFSFAPFADARAEDTRSFSIEAQDVASGLKLLALQGDFQVFYPADLAKGRKIREVQGKYTAAQALELALRGSGLTFRPTAEGTFVLELPAAVAPSRDSESSSQNIVPADTRAKELRLAQADTASASKANQPGSMREASGTTPQLAEHAPSVSNVPEILVIGSKTLNMDITRTKDDPQPYVVFDREKIQQSGAQSLESFLRDRLPMNANGIASSQRVTQQGAQSNFNLRGLGAGQTLILINGRRATPGPSNGFTPRQPDINGIPISAIQRIEVLPATASGIYGGSATGGVINIILRQDYTGTEVKATYGSTFESDVADRRVDLSTGFGLGARTTALVTASYSDQNPLNLRERPELVERYYDIVRANAPGALLSLNNPPLGSLTNIRSFNGSNLVLRNGTSLGSPITSVPAGYAGTAADGGQALMANAGNYNLGLADSRQSVTGAAIQLGTLSRKGALRATFQHEFSPRVRAFLETNASEVRTSGPPPQSNGTFLNPYRISASAPTNPFTQDILVTVPATGFAGAVETDATQRSATAGVIVALPADWKAEADYTWARMRLRQGGSQSVSNGADVTQIRNGQLDVLRDTRADPLDLSPYLRQAPFDAVENVTFQDVALRFAGPILELPAGPVNLSTLLEYRKENFDDATWISPEFSLFYPGRSASAASVYVETRVPLISAKNPVRAVEALELQLSVRGEEYRTHGQTGFIFLGSTTPITSADNETRSVNPTVAIRYQPIEDLAIRASYGTGFVAPDVSQLAPSIYPAPFSIRDPRRGGSSTTLQIGQIAYQGNPELGPEKSKSESIGLIVTPRFAPDLRLSLDYLRIRKTDNIASYPSAPQGIVDDEALLSGRIQRGPNLPGDPAGWAGPITFIDSTLFNISKAEVEAVDLQLDYSRSTDFGTFGFSTVASRQLHLKTAALPGSPELENVGVTYSNPQKIVGNAELRWQHRGWTVGWLARYYGSYFTADPAVAGNAANLTLQGDGGRVPSQLYHDLNVSWSPELSGQGLSSLLEDTELHLGIRNVFDKMPPFDARIFNQLRTLYSPLGDPLGATWQLAVTKRF
jgi:outer membrane receptor protein involved in Fe transport